MPDHCDERRIGHAPQRLSRAQLHDLGTTRAWIARKFRLRHVELIAALYECRSILKASRRLNLTQPTLTKALEDVEATLDAAAVRAYQRAGSSRPVR